MFISYAETEQKQPASEKQRKSEAKLICIHSVRASNRKEDSLKQTEFKSTIEVDTWKCKSKVHRTFWAFLYSLSWFSADIINKVLHFDR